MISVRFDGDTIDDYSSRDDAETCAFGAVVYGHVDIAEVLVDGDCVKRYDVDSIDD